jgi:hypothetical protein
VWVVDADVTSGMISTFLARSSELSGGCFGVVGFILYFIFSSPVEAAGLVRSTVQTAGGLLEGFAEGLSTFFRSLV